MLNTDGGALSYYQKAIQNISDRKLWERGKVLQGYIIKAGFAFGVFAFSRKLYVGKGYLIVFYGSDS